MLNRSASSNVLWGIASICLCTVLLAAHDISVEGLWSNTANAQPVSDIIHVNVNTNWEQEATGSSSRPYKTLQKAIDVSPSGSTILVFPGIYREHITLPNKDLNILGANPQSKAIEAVFPVLEGQDTRPVISLGHSESVCHIEGFVITHAQGPSGGAIACQGGQPTFLHCVITGHHIIATNQAVVRCSGSQASFLHCTVADNTVLANSSIFEFINSSIDIQNSIVWGNIGISIKSQGSEQPDIRYSNISGSWPGLGNLDTDPYFVQMGSWEDSNTLSAPSDPTRTAEFTWIPGNYRLQSLAAHWDEEQQFWSGDSKMSPCIDAGDPSSSFRLESLLSGERVNMGAFGGTSTASKSYITDRAVHFESVALKERVEEALGIFDPTPADMLGLVTFYGDFLTWGCSDLTGLEYAINLETLILNNNRCFNVNPLATLSKLRYLDISDNGSITNIAGLQDLIHLEFLDMHHNSLYNLYYLRKLTNLRELIVRWNLLAASADEIRPLTKLERVDISINQLTDIGFLTGMTHLKELVLDDNHWSQPQFDTDMATIMHNNPGLIIGSEKLRLTNPFVHD